MAIKIPIITELQDDGIKKAKREFDKFKGAVAGAEGGMGKFKAGTKSILDSVSANAGAFAAAGAAALGQFAAKGVQAFQELALGADKFASATGLAVEDASRWLEVAGDLGIDAGTVETAIGKMNQNLGASPDLFKQLGVQVAYAKDGTVDANKTFLNVIDRLKAIKDPAERAKVAAQLLGKGWREMATLINIGATDLQKSLDGVSDTKVINSDEVKKAKDFRDAMDKLNDVIQDITISLGQGLVPLLTDIGELAGTMSDLGNAFKKIPGVSWYQNHFGYFPGIQLLKDGFNLLGDSIGFVAGWFRDSEKPIEVYADALKAAREDQKDFQDLIKQHKLNELTDSVTKLKDALVQADTAWQTLTGRLDTRVAINNAQSAIDELAAATAKAFATGSASDIAKFEEQSANVASMLASIAANMDNISSKEMYLRLKLQGPQAALDFANWVARGGELGGLSSLQLLGAAGFSTLPGRAMGGAVSAGGTYLVGERGPELLTMGGSGTVTPIGGGGGNTINITVTSADPNQVVRALQAYVRQSGPVPVNTRAM